VQADKPPASRFRRRHLAVVAVLIVVVAVVVVAITDPFGSGGAAGGSEVNDGGTSLQAVVRGALSSQTETSGSPAATR